MVDMSNPPITTAALTEMRLSAVYFAAEGTNLYELRRPGGLPVPAFTAGSHVDLHLPSGLVRQYSILSAESERDRYLLGIKRDAAGRGGSIEVHDTLRVGTLLQVGGPRNHFPLNEDGAPAVFIAGGIGFTPLWSMVQRARHLGIDWRFHYAVRERAEAAMLRDIEGLGDNAYIHVDAEAGGAPMDLEAIIRAADPSAHLYCCGPSPMLDAFEDACRRFEVPPARVHLERFAAAPPEPVNTGFVVELARSGIEIAVGPGETILECARAKGVPVEASCEQGICGACETRVLAGLPDHHDMILSPDERASNKTIMICCSGSLSERLKLDL